LLVHVPAVAQAGQRVTPGLLAEPLGLLAGLGRLEHRLAGAGLRLALRVVQLVVRGKEDLVRGERLGEFAPGGVQFGLLLVDAYQNITQLALDTQLAGRVQAGLRAIRSNQSALRAGQREVAGS
jgi:hypothetical protein